MSHDCVWEQNADGVWETECDHAFEVTNGETPKRNGFVYCPFCRGWLCEIPNEEEE